MVFKLVRTDTEEPCKIQLRVGKHLIGRGKFLNCDDKRVSRNHGELEVMEDTVIVKALHQNPCFIIRKESEETQILTQNCTSNISNGDRFGLLPHTYWYELLLCTDVDQQPPSASSEQSEDIDSVGADTEPFDAESRDVSQEINFNLNETVANDKSPESPSLLPPESNDVPADNGTVAGTDGNECGGKSPIKRSHSSEENDDSTLTKKIKTEDEDDQVTKKIKTEDEEDQSPEIKQEPTDVQGSSNPAAGPSNDQAGPSSSNDKDKDAAKPASPMKRERCMYGANCYRKNPQHKAQFSHPSDSDWGGGARGECPYGAACRRRDPRHWRDHEHPPGVQPPQNNAGKRKKQTKKYSETDDDDDDDENTPPILNKKRTRKTVQYDWGDSDSQEEKDPYGTDDEDSEWQPSANSYTDPYD